MSGRTVLTAPFAAGAREALPRGRTLPEAVWLQRHRFIVGVLLLHIPLLVVLALFSTDYSLGHRLLEVIVPLSAASLVAITATGRRIRTAAATVGLMTSSALLVHLAGGLVEMHFHFFAMLALLVLYQEWVVLYLSVGYVLVHHGVVGYLKPDAVWANAVDPSTPLKWTLLHAGLVGVACIGHLVLWRYNERAQLLADEAIRSRDEAARDLVSARDEAMEASRLKSEFVANMSHEIRTPMNGVLGMTDLLLTTELSEEQREYTETVRSSAEALLAVVNDILDFSKIEAGRLDLDQTDFEVRSAVEEVAMLLAGAAQSKHLELLTCVRTAVPGTVRGDPGRLRQVLLNLAGNAVKFTEQGEVVITCDVSEATSDTVTLRFEVRDTGPGIAPQDQARLFASFTQVDTSSTRRHGGTGLGLAISRRLAELMGGEIGVESALGDGSKFWFTASFVPRPEGRLAASGSLRGLRVLVVDDNATNRTILQQLLLSWDMAPTVVDSGADALKRSRDAAALGRPFQVALIDFHMPTMDGAELARHLAADPELESMRRVLLTSTGGRVEETDNDDNDREVIGEHGAADEAFHATLTKPVRQSALCECISQLMGLVENATSASDVDVDLTRPMERRQPSLPVLVAEDNAVNQVVAARMLETLGCVAHVVSNGAEAVRAASSGDFAMVLMDCQMPEMDGYEATRQLRAHEVDGRRIPIVAMTASAMQGDAERCFAAGMDDYLSKPVSLDRLQDVLQRWLDDVSDESHPGAEGAPRGGPVPEDADRFRAET